jgi:hypothetical protein
MQFGMAGVSCFLAMPTHRDIPAATVMSLLNTQREMQTRGIPLLVHMEVGGSLVHHSRTSLVHQFLKTDCTHLFWVDSDIVWEVKDFERLLALATKMEVVCAAYPVKQDPPLFFLRYDETATHKTNEYGCLPVRGAGLGFSVIQRGVIEKLSANAPLRKYPFNAEPIPRVFRCDDDGTDARGEDMAFFSDICDLGYAVNLDPSVSLGHIGTKVYSGSIASMMEEI